MVHNNDSITKVNEVDGVSHENSCLIFANSVEDLFENVLPDCGIESRDRVIHEKKVSVSINGSCKTNPCLLAPGEVDAFLTNLSIIATWENFEV